MSNTPKTGNGHYSLDTYRAEAAKKGDKKGEFVLDIDTDRSISIPRPNGDQMFEAEAAMRAGDSKAVLEALCGGDLAREIIDILGPEDHSVLGAFGKDLQHHFGLGE